MKTYTHNRRRMTLAFTLIELLVVIAIIGILAGMLLPAIAKAKVRAQVSRAQTEMNQLVTAINAYYADYSVMPTSSGARAVGADLTWGTYNSAVTTYAVTNPAPVTYQANNSEIISILADMTTTPNGTATVNTNHQSNPRRTIYLNFKQAANAPSAGGVSDDGIYYDPWGNPYIISLDMDGDETVMDAFHRLDLVSADGPTGKGFRGMYRSATVAPPNNFCARGRVIVWSPGPDRSIVNTNRSVYDQNTDNLMETK